MAENDPRAKLAALVALLQTLDADYSEKRVAILAEMTALVNGDDGIGVKVARLKAEWSETWALRYQTPFVFTNHAMVGASLKRFLKTHSEAEITARMLRFIQGHEPFHVQTRHSFEVFVKSWNQLVGLPVERADSGQGIDALRQMRGK